MTVYIDRDVLLDFLIKSGKTDLIRNLFHSDTVKISSSELIDLVNPGQDDMVEINAMSSKKVSHNSGPKPGVDRFNIGQFIRFGSNPTIYKVVEGGLQNVVDKVVRRTSHTTAIEMAVAEKVGLEVIQARHPKGVAGLSHPKWNLVPQEPKVSQETQEPVKTAEPVKTKEKATH